MKDQIINGDTTWHRHVHAELSVNGIAQVIRMMNFQAFNTIIIWIDERKPTKRLSYDEGERYERYLVYNWDHYNGMPDHSLFDEPYLWTDRLSEVKAWVSKRCQNNRYTMEGMEIGYA
jgi:hypothetical protein